MKMFSNSCHNTIFLAEDEIFRCKKFSLGCSSHMREIEFGQHDTAKRSTEEIARDNLIGKLGEVAFAKFLKEKYGIEIELDFDIYPRGMWDSEDAIFNGWRFDVKATRPGSIWMLVEWEKLKARKKENRLPHIIVMTVPDWERSTNTPKGCVDIIGYAHLEQLRKGYPKTHVIKKGDTLPGKSVSMQATNYGRLFEDLDTDWDNLIDMVTTSSKLQVE